jgi:hypothetical protein
VPRQLRPQERQPLPHDDAPLQQKSANLIDDASALVDQPLSDAVQCLQVKLIGRLCHHKLHRGPLHRFSNGLRISEVVLLPLRIRPHVLCWHQPWPRDHF